MKKETTENNSTQGEKRVRPSENRQLKTDDNTRDQRTSSSTTSRYQPTIIYPPIEELRPTPFYTFARAAVYLLRNATICSLITVYFTNPFFFNVYLPSPLVRSLSPDVLFILTFQFLCHALPWLLFNSFYLTLDCVHPEFPLMPSWREKYPWLRALGDYFGQYKLPRRPVQIPSKKLILGTIAKVFVEQYLLTPVLGLLVFRYWNPTPVTESIPNPQQPLVSFTVWGKASSNATLFLSLIPHFILANLVNEIGFFLVHGIMHYNAFLYRTFHKQHHEYTGTISIAAEYASTTEELLANTVPSIGYFFFFFFAFTNSQVNETPSLQWALSARPWPLAMTWLWARLWETYESHSGYCFSDTFLGRLGLLHGHRARFHDFHHTHNLSNYGSGIVMDALCNTMDPYLKHQFGEKIKQSVAGKQRKSSPSTGKSSGRGERGAEQRVNK